MFKPIYNTFSFVLILLVATIFSFSQKSDKAETPLAKAVSEGKLEEAKELIKNGAKVDERSLGWLAVNIDTSLFIASNSMPSYSFLCGNSVILYNSEFSKHDNIGITPLHIAAYKGNSEIVRLLLENKADIEAKTLEGGTPLMLAVISGNLETVRLLLSHKTNIQTQTERGQTALMMASWNGRTSSLERFGILKTLILSGANVNLKNYEGKTALMGVAEENNIEVAKILIQANANLESADNEGKTALMYAIDAWNLEMTNFLVANKANVNATDNNSESPLMYAASKNRMEEIIRVLLVNGADTTTKEKNGVGTSLLLAKLNDYPETAKILEKAGASLSVNEKLILAAAEGNFDEVQKSLNQGGNPNAKGFGGKSVLFYAVRNDLPQITELLIKKGANVNQISNDDETPLMIASNRGSTKVAKLLIENGADVNAKDRSNYTPLIHAAWRGRAEIVKMLLEKGVEVNIQLWDGSTALDMAKYGWEGGKEAIKFIEQMLEKAGAKRMAEEEK